MSIPTVTPDRAPLVFCNLGYAHMEIGDLQAARADLETCRKWAKAEPDVARANLVAKLIDARSRPAAAVHPGEKIQRAAGLAKTLECPSGPNGAARLSIMTADGLMAFDLTEPAAVEMARVPAPSDPAFKLQCGALNPAPITVEYAPPVAGSTARGIARYLEF
jgi:hypothetical protein